MQPAAVSPGCVPRQHFAVALFIFLAGSAFSDPRTSNEAPLECNQEQATRQVKMFRSRPSHDSACPTHSWVERFQELYPAGPKVILDIGCNLGYQSVEFFDSFVPELQVNKRTLYDALEGEETRCNVCDAEFFVGECTLTHSTPPLAQGQSRSLEVHAFEPSDVHYPRLVKNRGLLFNAPQSTQQAAPTKTVGTSSGTWHLHNMAVSNFSGRANFSQSCNTGKCSLGDGASYTVKVTSVDDFVAAHGLKHIDIMKIDTEGFDPSVLQGATQLLQRHAVSMLLFEYLNVNLWQTTLLADVVRWLEGLGYVCYFEGRPHLYKLSRLCWDNRYEFKKWSNVVCGLAGGPMERILDQQCFLGYMQGLPQGVQQGGLRAGGMMRDDLLGGGGGGQGAMHRFGGAGGERLPGGGQGTQGMRAGRRRRRRRTRVTDPEYT